MVKKATQVNGHFLKLIFCMFEKSQGSFKCFEIFFNNCKVHMFKAWHKSKIFLHVYNTQTLRMDNPCFLKVSFFFYKMCTILLKIGMHFNIDNWKGKRIWIKENYWKPHLNTCGSKVLLTLKLWILKMWL